MSSGLSRALLMASLAAALQFGVLAWGVHGRAVILRDGAEVVLKTEPVDPRDLLRGRYVRLGYAISSLNRDLFDAGDRDRIETGAAVRVHLAPGPDGYWIADKAGLGAGADGADRTWIAGTVQSVFTGEIVSVDYGIERFYAPEYMAPEIERNMREGDVTAAVVAIGRDGTGQIKALRQGENALYVEPPY